MKTQTTMFQTTQAPGAIPAGSLPIADQSSPIQQPDSESSSRLRNGWNRWRTLARRTAVALGLAGMIGNLGAADFSGGPVDDPPIGSMGVI